MNDLPECFCDPNPGCDWDLNVSISYCRQGDDPAVDNSLVWNLKNIPQPLAQAIFQASVAATNEKGWEVYKAWLEGCAGEDNPVSALMKKMRV